MPLSPSACCVCVGGGAACGYCGVADRRSIIARMLHFAFSPKGSEVHPALKLLKDTVCGLFAWHMSWQMSTLGGDVGLVAVMLASFLSPASCPHSGPAFYPLHPEGEWGLQGEPVLKSPNFSAF